MPKIKIYESLMIVDLGIEMTGTNLSDALNII